MLEQQDDACAICLKPFTKTPNVDHNHVTNVIRGLLCTRCNLGVAFLEEQDEWEAKARAYLARERK